MKTNHMQLQFDAKSVNEGFARVAVAAFLTELNPTLDEIAESIHISKSECCRCFQRVLRVTPFEYLLKYRIFYATKLIQQQDPAASSISNLAITVGFGNISYFNKVFKRVLNMTPTEYKKQEGLS